MTILPMFPEHDSGNDDTPLPLLVAKKWDFPLAFHVVEGQYYYAVQDWVRGLFGEEDIRHIWANQAVAQLVISFFGRIHLGLR